MSPSEISAFIVSLDPPFTVSHTGFLKFGSKSIKDNVLSEILAALPPEASSKLSDFVGVAALEYMRNAALGEQLKLCLISSLKIKATKEAEERKRQAKEAAKEESQKLLEESRKPLSEIFFNPKFKEPLSEQIVIINSKDPSKSFLYQEKGDRTYEYHSELMESRINRLIGKGGFQSFCDTNAKDCNVRYVVNQPRIFDDPEDDSKDTFNRWKPAEWAKDWEAYKNGKLPESPELFKILMDHLVANEKDRHTVQSWLRDAVFDRAGSIMVLCGVPGTGKNLLIEKLGMALVGASNFRSSTRAFSRTQFHSNVTNCQMFFLDETPLSPATREILKSFHNDYVTVERKYTEVDEPERVWASFVLTNNKKSAIELSFDDRKFYVPDLSEVSIEKAMGRKAGREFAAEFKEACNTPAFLQDVANYLYWNFTAGQSSNFDKKTKTFIKVCTSSLPDWFTSMRNFYKRQNLKGERREFAPSEVIPSTKDRPTHGRAEDLLDEYSKCTDDYSVTVKLNRDNSWSFIFNPTAEDFEAPKHSEGEELHI